MTPHRVLAGSWRPAVVAYGSVGLATVAHGSDGRALRWRSHSSRPEAFLPPTRPLTAVKQTAMPARQRDDGRRISDGSASRRVRLWWIAPARRGRSAVRCSTPEVLPDPFLPEWMLLCRRRLGRPGPDRRYVGVGARPRPGGGERTRPMRGSALPGGGILSPCAAPARIPAHLKVSALEIRPPRPSTAAGPPLFSEVRLLAAAPREGSPRVRPMTRLGS